MPRPKRTKIATGASVAPVSDASAISRSSKSALPSSVAQVDAHDGSSGDSDTLQVKTRPARAARSTRTTRRGATGAEPAQAQDVMMTGALEQGDGKRANKTANAAPKKNVRTRGRMAPRKTLGTQDEKALQALKKRRDEALRQQKGEGAAPTPMSAVAKLAARRASAGSKEASSPAVQRAAKDATTTSPAVVSVQRNSDVIISSPERPAVPRSAMKPPSSAVKAQGTPAVETSVLALSKFKRRPRQPSILRMVQQTSDHEQGDNIEESLGDFDFDPDDESTPLKLNPKGVARRSLGTTPGARSEIEPRTSSSRKRKLRSAPEPEEIEDLDEQEEPQDEEMPEEPQEQEESEIQVPRSSPPIIERPPAPTRELEDTDDEEHLYSDVSDLPQQQVIKNTQDRPEEEQQAREATPEVYSSTMAPPKSTSSLSDGYRQSHEAEEIPAPSRRRQLGRARARTRNYDESPDEASGSEEEEEETTPVQKKRNKKQTRQSKKDTKPQALSTATLQALLPRRRTAATKQHKHATDTFDIPSSDSIVEVHELGSDEDELQHAPLPRRGRSGRSKAPSSTAAAGKKKGTAQTQKQKQMQAQSRPGKTYSRRSSDKENASNRDDGGGRASDGEGEEDEEDEGEATETPHRHRLGKRAGKREAIERSKELDEAARKFKEIDDWEMAFESVELGASGSSPWR